MSDRWLPLSLLGMLAVACGCTSGVRLPLMSWQKIPLDAEAGLYKSAEIVYCLDAGRLTLPVSVTRVEGQRVSYEELVTRPEPGCAGGRLTIRYPHPDGRTDFAEARLVVDRDPRKPVVLWKPNSWRFRGPQSPAEEATHEEWRLDLTKADLDALINGMRDDGCFTQDQPHAKAAQLTIGFNGHRRTKPWSQSPPLERCMQRVRREGQLIAFSRPAMGDGAVSMTSSLESYRSLVAEGGGGDAPSAKAVAISGLIMPKTPNALGAPANPATSANGPMIAANTPPAGAAVPPGYQSPMEQSPVDQASSYPPAPHNPAPFNSPQFNSPQYGSPIAGPGGSFGSPQTAFNPAPTNTAPFGQPASQAPFGATPYAPTTPSTNPGMARLPGGPRW